MSTALLESRLPRTDVDRRPTLLRLTAVELRKMVDTRAGFWLLLTIVGLTVIALAAVLATVYFGDSEDPLYTDMFVLAALPTALLLPIVGILLVSSEWTQRTTMITFTLVPRRWRVVAAKVGAGVGIGIAAIAIDLALATIGTLAAQPDVDGAWSLSWVMVGQVALYVVAAILMGVAFGAMLLSSAPAIVLYFVMPIALSAIGGLPWFRGVVPWIDWWNAVSILADKPLTAVQWARAGTTLALWIAVPLAVGLWRITRRDID